MKTEDQNIAIATALGEIYHKPTEKELAKGSYMQYEPDYVGSLDNMHRAEKVLNDEQRVDYIERLLDNIDEESCDLNPRLCEWSITHATGAQRAEAFLKTIEKWVEE